MPRPDLALLFSAKYRASAREGGQCWNRRLRVRWVVAVPAVAIVFLSATSGTLAADASLKNSGDKAAYEWNGFYVGGHIGYAWGNSDYTISPTPGQLAGNASGSLDFSQGINSWNEGGSWFEGLQAGYNAMLPNRVVFGVEADGSFPAYQNLSGVSIGSVTNFSSPSFGAGSYSDTLIASSTARARIGYAPGNWLFYATGGFAWTFDQLTLSQFASGNSPQKYQWRTGWAAGAGAEFTISGHWTGKVEYLYTDYGVSSPPSPILGQHINSDLSLQEVRVGLNYQLGNAVLADEDPKAPAAPILDNISLHGQFTALEQAYPAFYSRFPDGPNSLPKGGLGRETTDLTLYTGVKLLGRGQSSGLIPRSTRASASATPTGWQASRARNPTSSAGTGPTRG